VIPARNERPTIQAVVQTCTELCESDGRFTGVIVVSDGSVDGTAELASAAGATVVRRPIGEHGSKSLAMHAALEHVPSDAVFFVDADCIGLTTRHLLQIAEPLFAGHCLMSVGVFDYGVLSRPTARLPLTTGERILPMSVMTEAFRLNPSGYGIETAINAIIGKHRATTSSVTMTGVHQRTKRSKFGFLRGLHLTANMTTEVIAAILKQRWDDYSAFLASVEVQR